MDTWYYNDNGTQCGPISHSELLEKIRNGVVLRDTLVWKSGMSNWDCIANIKELRETISTPPPLPNDIPSTKEAPKVPLNYPWRRLLAKIIDIQVALFLGTIVVIFATPERNDISPFLLAISMLLTWIVIDAITKCRTIGRYLLGITVKQTRQDSSFGDRALKLLFVGLCLEIPLISLIPKFIAYKKYRRTGTTYWDSDAFAVTFTKNRIAIYIGALLSFIAISTTYSLSVIALGRTVSKQSIVNQRSDASQNDVAQYSSRQKENSNSIHENIQKQQYKLENGRIITIPNNWKIDELANGVPIIVGNKLSVSIRHDKLDKAKLYDQFSADHTKISKIYSSDLSGWEVVDGEFTQLNGYRNTRIILLSNDNKHYVSLVIHTDEDSTKNSRYEVCSIASVLLAGFDFNDFSSLAKNGSVGYCKDFY